MAKKPLPRIELDGVFVPIKIGGGYKPLKVYPLTYIYGSEAARHRRLFVFHYKGIKCVCPGCEMQGYYVILGRDQSGGLHMDLYTKDFVLMTVDHIHPKSKGGSEELHNKQPMCEPHNSKKGALLPGEFLSNLARQSVQLKVT